MIKKPHNPIPPHYINNVKIIENQYRFIYSFLGRNKTSKTKHCHNYNYVVKIPALSKTKSMSGGRKGGLVFVVGEKERKGAAILLTMLLANVNRYNFIEASILI